ncbi:MAG: ComEC/Rec2 family competence protein [Synergistaceae bacterium]|nr:ComEC/Rec2 family competence protein [Synergistaceae bacterium]
MEILRRAPMLGVLAGIISGLAMYDRAGIWAFVVMVPMVYSGVMLCSYEWELPGQWRVFGAGVVLCALCSVRCFAVLTKPPAENITLTQAAGTVTGVRAWGRQYVLTIDVDGGGRYAARMRFPEIMQGTRIKFDGVTRSFRQNEKFDEARYWGARGISSWISIHNVEELPRKFSFARMRYLLSRKLTMYLPDATASYLKAMWLGERDDLLNRMHRRWGTVHLLAVSGFHVGIIVMCASLIFGNNAVLLSVIMWAYIFLTGAAPSALRAGLMFQAGLIAKILGRPASGVNSVSVAGVMILMWSPLMFWDIGFRLSVLCALTITTLPRKWWLMVSPLMFLVSFPQVSRTFGEIMLVGIVLNIFAPLYFTFALSVASVLGVLRLLNVPLMNYVLLAVEGGFLLWERAADFAAESIPYSVGWNYITAWIGAGVLVWCLCRYFELAPLRSVVVMAGVSFAAFLMFS